eukprot:scaffold66446_cov40-Prasinocladus_malaysianus.AAC.1
MEAVSPAKSNVKASAADRRIRPRRGSIQMLKQQRRSSLKLRKIEQRLTASGIATIHDRRSITRGLATYE